MAKAHKPVICKFRAMPGYGKVWTDHSKRPELGMMVQAYFLGTLTTKFLVEWCKDGCTAYFHDGYSLHWSRNLGFL